MSYPVLRQGAGAAAIGGDTFGIGTAISGIVGVIPSFLPYFGQSKSEKQAAEQREEQAKLAAASAESQARIAYERAVVEAQASAARWESIKPLMLPLGIGLGVLALAGAYFWFRAKPKQNPCGRRHYRTNRRRGR